MKIIIALALAPFLLAACAETPPESPKPEAPKPEAPKPEAPKPETSKSEVANQAPASVPGAKMPGASNDDLTNATVLATRFDDRVELAVRLPARPKGYGYDPTLTVGDRTLREYRYEDGDRTLVFVESEPAKLPTAASASLAFGHGSTVVRKAQLPLLFAPKTATER